MDYQHNRTQYQDISGTTVLAATDGDTTLVTGRTGYTIFIQKLRAVVVTDAAQSCWFEDNASTPKKVLHVPASPGVGAEFRAAGVGDEGIALGEAKNLVANVSAAGLRLEISWEGYMKPTGVLLPSQI